MKDISQHSVKEVQDRIEAIQKEIRETPYHKGTEHFIGLMRARIARLKDKLIDKQSKGKGGGGGGGYAVKKQGDATIVLVGPPSSGKSTLLNKLTNAQSKVAPYEFTTVSVIPGMMEYKNAKIQILDVPGLIEGAEEGKGRGREVLSVIRGCDLILLMTDIKRKKAIENISNALERNGIRINKKKPEIKIDKKLSGGLIIHTNIKQDSSKETIKEVISEMGLKNGEITIKEKVSIDDLIDAFSKNRVYIPALFIVNKIDLLNKNLNYENIIPISAETNTGIDNLLEKIWQKLDFINVYLVKKDEEPSKKGPLVVQNGINLASVANKIGEDFAKNIDHAVIWGNGAKFPGQEVSLSTKVEEGMQIRFL